MPTRCTRRVERPLFQAAYVPFGQTNDDNAITVTVNQSDYTSAPTIVGGSTPVVGASGIVATANRQQVFLGPGALTSPAGPQPAAP